MGQTFIEPLPCSSVYIQWPCGWEKETGKWIAWLPSCHCSPLNYFTWWNNWTFFLSPGKDKRSKNCIDFFFFKALELPLPTHFLFPMCHILGFGWVTVSHPVVALVTFPSCADVRNITIWLCAMLCTSRCSPTIPPAEVFIVWSIVFIVAIMVMDRAEKWKNVVSVEVPVPCFLSLETTLNVACHSSCRLVHGSRATLPSIHIFSSRGLTLIRQLHYQLSIFLTRIPSSVSTVPQSGQIKELWILFLSRFVVVTEFSAIC